MKASSVSSVNHVVHAATIHLSGSLEQVFPLFTPLGEKQWAEGWDPQVIYPESGQPEIGAVFTTQHHDGGKGETATWIVVDYAPEQGRIAYARVAPTSHAALLTVQCAKVPDGSTSANVSYSLTALGEAGNAFLAHLDEAHYRQWMSSWQDAINHYLQHGKLLAHH
jgi:hypothetical protein